MYQEPAVHRIDDAEAGGRVSFRNVLAFENFVLLMAVVFGLQFVDRSFGPVLPLYVTELGTPADRVAIVSGILFSIAAGAGAVGHHFCGRLLKRSTARAVIATSVSVGAAGAMVYVLAGSAWLLVLGTAGVRAGDRRGDDGRLHGGEQRDAGHCARRRVRAAHDARR